ncbi:thioredoxin-domain-containing protein [Ascoidea rubescens DSM 1968]|uniref:protein disulfide-isomerase n=1 Tax=Ascoidea rubescens DSM 1968 TaxID=1344418 RepID=A0A1D2VJQ5_9ASCO|nr:thioredoxin-domain-containing protein [Ascoidea rubescens DSM 1968]ODV61800.1 thioredoxin-domain-containing protein [Ascoidea rubescens DSM 1968]
MRVLSGLIFLLVAIFALIEASSVIEADNKSFNDLVVKSGKYSFVKFYASWCGHCKKLEPIFDELSDVYKNTDEIQIIKIDADKNSKIGKKYGIESYPTLKLFKPNDPIPVPYEKARDINAFKDFIYENSNVYVYTPKSENDNNIKILHDDNFEKELLNNNNSKFIAITATWCGHCKNLKPIWYKLSKLFKSDFKSIEIYEVPTSDYDADLIKKTFGVSGFPTIIYLPSNIKDTNELTEKYEVYRGGRSIENFIEFINEKTNINRESNGNLNDNAGRLSNTIDLKIVKLLDSLETNESNETNEISTLIEGIKNEIQKEYSSNDLFTYSIKYYEKLLNKLGNNEVAFFQKELSRLVNMLEKNEKNLTQDKNDNLRKRINILKLFNKQEIDLLLMSETDENAINLDVDGDAFNNYQPPKLVNQNI